MLDGEILAEEREEPSRTERLFAWRERDPGGPEDLHRGREGPEEARPRESRGLPRADQRASEGVRVSLGGDADRARGEWARGGEPGDGGGPRAGGVDDGDSHARPRTRSYA